MVARMRFGVHALAELDEGVLVEPDPGDVARDGLVEDRLGRRTERRPLGAQDEALELGLPVELRVGLDEVVDQPDGELAGGQADLLVDVAVDDVVDAGLPLHLAGLAAPDVVTDDLLEGERAVLGDVPEPGAFVEPLHEATAAAARARVVLEAGQHLEELLGEAGQLVGRVVLERAQVDDEVDGLLVGPDVRAAVDAGLQDGEVGRGAFGHDSVPPHGIGGAAGPAPARAPGACCRSCCVCGSAVYAGRPGWHRRRRCHGPAGACPAGPPRARRRPRGPPSEAAARGSATSGRTPTRPAAGAGSRRSRAAEWSAWPRRRWRRCWPGP